MTTQPISAHSNEEFYLKTQRYLFQQHDVNSWQTSYFLFYTPSKNAERLPNYVLYPVLIVNFIDKTQTHKSQICL